MKSNGFIFLLRFSLLICIFHCFQISANAQAHSAYDSNFVISYADQVTGRTFLSQKYTIFAVEARPGVPQLQYRPNTTVNLGVGVTYRSITLNLAYGFPFLNRDSEKGKTKYLDLQSHIYGYKWSVDILGQFYKGYFLYPRGFAASDPVSFYLRPDLRVEELGGHVYYILNHEKFSYRAAFVQNAWQKKSAGSLMLGGSLTYGSVHADSSFVPFNIADNYLQKSVGALNYFELGPGLAYAYTYVYKLHWFITAAATLSLDLGFAKEFLVSATVNNTHVSPNFLFRSVAGYNGPVWNVNLSWVSNRTAVHGQYRDGGYHVNTGRYVFTIARRFQLRSGMKSLL